MTQPKANKLIHLLSTILLSTLKHLGELPEKNEYRLVEQLKFCTDVILDGTERYIQRPKDDEVQKSC
ncbi:MAG: DDE transposase family protein, partial [Paludibacteraceae bacterium]